MKNQYLNNTVFQNLPPQKDEIRWETHFAEIRKIKIDPIDFSEKYSKMNFSIRIIWSLIPRVPFSMFVISVICQFEGGHERWAIEFFHSIVSVIATATTIFNRSIKLDRHIRFRRFRYKINGCNKKKINPSGIYWDKEVTILQKIYSMIWIEKICFIVF